ncbi:MAG: hypothetical protein ACLFUB_19025 [Cyclobacteriaceae bacterium]
MELTMFIPFAVIILLIVSSILFYLHRKRRKKYHLDEKEEAIRHQESQDSIPNKNKKR